MRKPVMAALSVLVTQPHPGQVFVGREAWDDFTNLSPPLKDTFVFLNIPKYII